MNKPNTISIITVIISLFIAILNCYEIGQGKKEIKRNNDTSSYHIELPHNFTDKSIITNIKFLINNDSSYILDFDTCTMQGLKPDSGVWETNIIGARFYIPYSEDKYKPIDTATINYYNSKHKAKFR